MNLLFLVGFSECSCLPLAGGDSGANTINVAEAYKKRKPGVNFPKIENMSRY